MAASIFKGPCFIVASDEAFRFADSAQVREGAGAFLYRVDDAAVGESLIELYKAECPGRDFDLSLVPAGSLSAHELVLVNREISRGEAIGRNLDSDDYRSADPVFCAIGKCAITLDRLESELRTAMATTARSAVSEIGSDAYLAKHRLLLPVAKPQTLAEAFERLAFVLERHRLMFLHFAGAVRRNPNALGGPTGIYERVRADDIRGHEQYFKDVDSDGEFLFKNRWFLEHYVDEAISRFGSGEGHKPDVEGATHPYWSLDDIGAGYLQESADVIHTCAIWLREFDSRGECKELIEDCLAVAYDRGRSRWYSSIATRWQYVAELDDVIAAVKRAAVIQHHSGHSPSESTAAADAWFYLRVSYDEAMFNHDPGSLGTVVGDPNYYPLDSGTFTFFKVRGEVLAQRLIRLFDRGVKPYVEQEGETRVRVSFRYERADSFDEDDIFLIEEELANARAEVERLDREWAIQTGPKSRAGQVVDPGDVPLQRRPLSGEGLSAQRMYDRARRWCEKLSESANQASSQSEPNQQPESESNAEPAPEPASDEMLRLALPTAVMSAIGLRDLRRIRAFYPDAIPEDEARSLHAAFAENLKSAAAICKLEQIFQVSPIPSFEEAGFDLELSAMMGMLALHHPDTKIDPTEPDAPSKNMDASFSKCQEEVTEPVRGMIERLINAMLFDCRIPNPADDKTFDEPQRFLQMLRSYWGVVRQLVLHHTEAPIGYRPHPLMPLVVNLKARIDSCFDRLADLPGAAEARERVTGLIDIVLSGEPDDLQAAPEWSFGEISSVDRFIEEARLTLGAKSYPLTPAEEMCLSYAAKSVQDYEDRVKNHWTKVIKRLDAKKEPQSSASPSTTNAALGTGQPPRPPQPFTGGAMVYIGDRVEFCGQVICKGPRSDTRRRILNLLKMKTDGKFKAYSGEELAQAAGICGGARSIPGAIRELRDDIVESLRELNITVGRFEVVQNDKSGYHFADCVSVQEPEPEISAANADTESVADVRDVRNAPVRNVPNQDEAVDPRIEWILKRLEEGQPLKGPDVAREFGCSDKTALRLLGALKDQGKIEFVGATRTGHYRLLQPRPTDG